MSSKFSKADTNSDEGQSLSSPARNIQDDDQPPNNVEDHPGPPTTDNQFTLPLRHSSVPGPSVADLLRHVEGRAAQPTSNTNNPFTEPTQPPSPAEETLHDVIARSLAPLGDSLERMTAKHRALNAAMYNWKYQTLQRTKAAKQETAKQETAKHDPQVTRTNRSFTFSEPELTGFRNMVQDIFQFSVPLWKDHDGGWRQFHAGNVLMAAVLIQKLELGVEEPEGVEEVIGWYTEMMEKEDEANAARGA